jgi:hypothetical protein
LNLIFYFYNQCKPAGLSLSKSRNAQFPNIVSLLIRILLQLKVGLSSRQNVFFFIFKALLESSVLTNDIQQVNIKHSRALKNLNKYFQPIIEKERRRKKRRDCDTYLVCQCYACLNSRLPRTESLLVLIDFYRINKTPQK